MGGCWERVPAQELEVCVGVSKKSLNFSGLSLLTWKMGIIIVHIVQNSSHKAVGRIK